MKRNRNPAVAAAVLLLTVSAASTAHAAGEPYAWAISASDTDPFVQIAAPLPEPGVVTLHLWLVAGYPMPTAYPNGHLGFASDGSTPCASGDCVDPATPVGEVETSTWGRIKDTYR